MLKTIFISTCFIIPGLLCIAQKNQGVLNYINTYKDLAIEEMQRSGVPASIKLAQGIHETEAGNSELARKGNNHFGIKCKNTWKGEKIYHDDDARGECFRSYSTAEDSYRDHSDFLRNNDRYAFLFKLEPEDYKGWAYGLREAGYATNIRYSQLIIKLIEDYNLQEYTLLALNKLPNKQTEKIIAKDETVPASSEPDEPVSNYPTGVFELNKTKAIFVKAGSSLLAIATEYDLPLARLIDFNDLLNDESPKKGQLIFLQRKRKTGVNIYHVMQAGETIYDVCQMEGIRMESLLQYNMLPAGVQVAEGEKIYLQEKAPLKPMLAEEKNRLQKVIAQQDEPQQLHTVQPKETLYSIARKYKVTVGQLQEWNKLNTFDLKTGQQIKIKPSQLKAN